MSAIFGLINLDGRPAAEADLNLMSAALSAHGPDGNYVWTKGNVGLGQRLTRFMPEDCLDRQPAIHGERQHLLVADARIDNRPELREELGISPEEARELSDSAFILRAYGKWGTECPRHLIGAFVFALCDPREQIVLIVRSPMGERSLFYYEAPRLFAFASAPKGLFALPFVPREINRQSIADFLASVPNEPGTSFFSGINRLQAGHTIVVQGGKFKSQQYRGLEIQHETRFPRDSDYVEAFNSLFDRVIADQLRSLTPVGVSMSGGLDSTAVAAAAALILKREGKRLHTFTEIPRAGFSGALPEGQYADETPCVQAMARKYDNLDVHFVPSQGRFYLDDLDRFFAAADAPMLGASNLPWLEAIQEKAYEQNVRILLTGTPGNFTVSWDGQGLLPQLLREWKWSQAIREARALAANNTAWSTPRILAAQGMMPLLPNLLWVAAKQLRAGGIPGFTAERFCHSYSPIRPEFARKQRMKERVLDRLNDFRFGAPPGARALTLLRLADQRSDGRRRGEALFGVQKRDPAADIRLVEFCLSIPEDQYLRDGKSRWLIRRATADRLPAQVLENKKRGLQAADWFESMSAARFRIAEELARLESSALASEIIDLGRLRLLVERIQDAPKDIPRLFADYRGVLELGITTGRFLSWVEAGI